MDIIKNISGRPSYYFSVGFFALLFTLPLLYTVKTALYSEVASLIKATPLSSVIAASPAVFILGILINQARIVFAKYIFRSNTYILDKLSDPLKNELNQAISKTLSLQEEDSNLVTDDYYTEAKLLVMPLFDQYTIVHRWLNDFLENVILISGFVLLVIGFRAIGYAFEGIEVTLLEICSVIILFSTISLKGQRKKYTIAEVGIFLTEAEKLANKQ